MTDNEIIKAFECCVQGNCDDCPFMKTRERCYNLDSLTIDLINRQNTEIEELKAINESRKTDRPFLIAISRSEARKEFAEKVDKLLTEHSRGDIDDTELYRLFDNILEEMESESNGI